MSLLWPSKERAPITGSWSRQTKSSVLITIFLLCSAALLCSGCRSKVSERPIGKVVTITPPLGLPPVPIPANNPPTAETIALGRRLFYDKRLSKNNTLACANCHQPQYYFTDGLKFSHGVGGAIGVRNAPTIMNAAYMPFQFWDGRAINLEQQAASPMSNPIEMDQPHDVSVEKLQADPTYQAMFTKAFGTKDVTIGRIEKSLASFERTVLSGDSPFDRYEYGGQKDALTPSQIRGLAIFSDPRSGNCTACHLIGKHSALFTDGKFHNIGEGVGDNGGFDDIGRYHETKIVTDKGAFKTPTLRNVAETAPYMHDGSIKTLEEVVSFYAGGGNSNPYLDKQIKAIHLSGQDRIDLVAFLKSLTGDMPPNVGPPGKE